MARARKGLAPTVVSVVLLDIEIDANYQLHDNEATFGFQVNISRPKRISDEAATFTVYITAQRNDATTEKSDGTIEVVYGAACTFKSQGDDELLSFAKTYAGNQIWQRFLFLVPIIASEMRLVFPPLPLAPGDVGVATITTESVEIEA